MGDMTITESGFEPDTGVEVETGYDPSTEIEMPSEVPTESIEPPEGALFEYDGQWITQEEARLGYLRQADYTRKTQELSEARRQADQYQRLEQQLKTDPERTLRVLAASFGVELTPAQAAHMMEQDEYGEDPYNEIPAPVREQLQRQEQLLAQIEQERVVAEVQREIDAVTAKYGEFDVLRVLEHADRGGFPSVEAAYKSLAFDDLKAAQEEEARKRAAADAAAVEAKRQGQVVHQGGSRTNTEATYLGEAKPQSVRESWAFAKKKLGIE